MDSKTESEFNPFDGTQSVERQQRRIHSDSEFVDDPTATDHGPDQPTQPILFGDGATGTADESKEEDQNGTTIIHNVTDSKIECHSHFALSVLVR